MVGVRWLPAIVVLQALLALPRRLVLHALRQLSASLKACPPMPVTRVIVPPPETKSILLKAGLPVGRIIRVTSGGDVGDGLGEEVLFVTDDACPRPMVARIVDGKVSESRHGW